MGKSYFILKQSLAQAALRAPPEAALQCVVGHCYYHISVFLSFFLSFPGLAWPWHSAGLQHYKY